MAKSQATDEMSDASMTTIFNVSVDDVQGSTFRGRVHVINPDVPSVPEKAVFPLSLLVDAWWHLDNGFLHDEKDDDEGDRYPLTSEEGRRITANMRLRSEFLRLFDFVLGKKLRVTEDGFLLADDAKTVLEPKRLAKDVYVLDGGRGYDGISKFVMTPGDEKAFSASAAAIVTSYEISPYLNVPLLSEVAALEHPERPWQPGQPDGPADLEHYGGAWDLIQDRPFDEFPYAEITVTVSDAGYLEHLTPGMRWGTTMTGHVC